MARIFVVLALDAILVGAGVAMIAAYLSARHEAAERAAPPEPPPAGAEVEVGPARPVGTASPDAATLAAAGDAGAGAATARGATTPPRSGEPKTEKGTSRGAKPPAAGSHPGSASPGSGSASGGGASTPDPTDAAEPGADDPKETPPPAADAGTPDEEEVSRFAARINAVVARHRSQLQRCYERASKTTSPEEPLEGRVDIRFRIMPNGSAQQARPVANTTGSEILAGCLVAVVESWEFPTGASAPLDFVWPFRFRARKP